MGGSNPFSMFEKQARANMEMVENTMRMFTPGSASRKSKRSDKAPQISEDPMDLLKAQMAAMQEQLDALSRKH